MREQHFFIEVYKRSIYPYNWYNRTIWKNFTYHYLPSYTGVLSLGESTDYLQRVNANYGDVTMGVFFEGDYAEELGLNFENSGVTINVEDPSILKFDGNKLTALNIGSTNVSVTYRGVTSTERQVTVTAKDYAARGPVSVSEVKNRDEYSTLLMKDIIKYLGRDITVNEIFDGLNEAIKQPDKTITIGEMDYRYNTEEEIVYYYFHK
jgi:hypothetical protein